MQDLHQSQSDCIDHGKIGDRVGYSKTHYRNGIGVRVSTMRHRLVYCESNGLDLLDIKGKVVRHKCDNPRCINPDHLEVGTQAENIADRQLRNRQAVGESIGCSKLTSDIVLHIRSEYIKGSSEFGTNALGRKYGVSNRSISDIVRRITWRHI